jgi:hypothetical protein
MVNWEKLLSGLIIEATSTSLGGTEDMNNSNLSNTYTSEEAAR